MIGKLILIAIIVFLVFVLLSLAFYVAFGLFFFTLIVRAILEGIFGVGEENAVMLLYR